MMFTADKVKQVLNSRGVVPSKTVWYVVLCDATTAQALANVTDEYVLLFILDHQRITENHF